MSSVFDAARAWLESGAAIVPIPHRSKAPVLSEWQKLRISDDTLPRYFNGAPQNIGLLLGEPSNWLIDVDLDVAEAVALAPYLLPKTAVFGRAGNPDSHYLYRAQGAVTSKWTLPAALEPDKDRRMLVELRSTGAQTVVPPSTHPSGDSIAWRAGRKPPRPTRIDADQLRRRLQLLASGAVLIRTWKEGVRHSLALALSGALLTSGWSGDETAQLIEALCRAAGDPETEDRLEAVRTSAEALRSAKPCTGIPTLAALLGEPVIAVLKRAEWLNLGGASELNFGPAQPPGSDAEFGDKASARKAAAPLGDERNHYELAVALIDELKQRHGHAPIGCMGSLWIVRDAIWRPLDIGKASVIVGEHFSGGRYCRRGSDFSAVAKLAYEIVEDDEFFRDAPAGVATPGAFWSIDEQGEVVRQELTPEHRQRMRVNAEPDFDAEPCELQQVLDNAFGDPDEGQGVLLQMAFGGALARILWKHRVAILLFGATTTGKSVLLEVLQSFFPADQRSATSPQRWASEYYVAALAGTAINVVGELDPDEPIPGGAFKAIVGRDLVQGRHPTHRPFSFISQAAHFFNANRLPPTLDRGDAFFRRWRIIHFRNPVAEDQLRLGLAETIIDTEMDAVLAWMLQGASMLVKAGRLPEPAPHRRLLEKWRAGNNSALQFLLDRHACTLDVGAEVKGITLFDAYRQWATTNGLRGFGRNHFYEALTEGAGRIGVTVKDTADGVVVLGVELAPASRAMR